MKSPIVTLSDGSTIDLSDLKNPFGMYPEEVQRALRDHGGPYQVFVSNGWDDVNASSFPRAFTCRVAPQPLTKPDVPWHMMADWVKAVARDEDGTIWAYGDVPRCGEGCWQAGARLCALDALKINPGTCGWRDSLVLRP
jgi:hypothetical protein